MIWSGLSFASPLRHFSINTLCLPPTAFPSLSFRLSSISTLCFPALPSLYQLWGYGVQPLLYVTGVRSAVSARRSLCLAADFLALLASLVTLAVRLVRKYCTTTRQHTATEHFLSNLAHHSTGDQLQLRIISPCHLYIYIYIGGWGRQYRREIDFGFGCVRACVRASEAACGRVRDDVSGGRLRMSTIW